MGDSAWLILRGLCRGLHLAGYFAGFGTAFFAALFGPLPGFKRLAWAGFALALAGGAGWFWLQTAYFASANTPASVVAALPLVAGYTRFGWLTLARMGVLLLAMLGAQAGRWRAAALLAGLGVLAQSWLGHGAAMGGAEGHLLLACSLLHVGAAACWLGTLPSLALAVARSNHPQALAQAYSRLGLICVALILVSAFLQYWLLIGHLSAFLTTGYGAAALLKTALFAVLLILAARNRLRLTPALPAGRASLRRAIAWEITLGLILLATAGVLMQLPPPAMAGMEMG